MKSQDILKLAPKHYNSLEKKYFLLGYRAYKEGKTLPKVNLHDFYNSKTLFLNYKIRDTINNCISAGYRYAKGN